MDDRNIHVFEDGSQAVTEGNVTVVVNNQEPEKVIPADDLPQEEFDKISEKPTEYVYNEDAGSVEAKPEPILEEPVKEELHEKTNDTESHSLT